MTHWSDLRKRLEELLELSAADADRRLAELRRSDPALADELAGLLEHDHAAERTPGFLEPDVPTALQSPPFAAHPASSAALAPATSQRLGPYERLGELGRGGMGVVYLARRADGAFQRRVAIKVLRDDLGLALEGTSGLARFQRERQVLANLEHPGIARLIDGGTADGAPFLVMEYVEGLPIDKHCDMERLGLRARVELFLGVCAAVQHAHHHLVVHRDLKPSNIVVTPEGAPKLLDFGIAKVLDPEKSSASPDVTQLSTRHLTPAYASPEQVAGRPITTSSDIYSLGVVLFELLTGRAPYSVDTTSAVELERIVGEVDPPRPSLAVRDTEPASVREARAKSRATTPRGWERALTGDLDRIVLKALRKEPQARYGTVEAFADDLRRHLDGLPVSARRPSWGYRAARFLRRNRAISSAAAALLLALLFGFASTLRQYHRAETAWAAEREQRTLAEAHLKESRKLASDLDVERSSAVQRAGELERLNGELDHERRVAKDHFDQVYNFASQLIFDLHDELTPINGTLKVREKLVKSGIEQMDRLALEAAGDPKLAFELAIAYVKLAGIQGAWAESNLGQFNRALETIDKTLDLTEVLLARTGDPSAGDPPDTPLVAPTEPEAQTEADSEDTVQSRDSAATATRGQRPRARDVAVLRARAHLIRSSFLMGLGRDREAEQALELALNGCAFLRNDPGATAGQLYVLYGCHGRYAEVLFDRGNLEQARVHMRAGEELLLELRDKGGVAISIGELELVRSQLARVEYALGHRDAAFELHLAALDSMEAIAKSDPDDLFVLHRLRGVRNAFADMLAQEGEVEGAAELLESNRDLLRRQIQASPDDTQLQLELSTSTLLLMRTRFVAEDYAGMVRLAEASLPLAKSLVDRVPENVLAIESLAKLYADLGRAQRRLELPLEAGTNLTLARDTLERCLQLSPGDVVARRYLLDVYAELGRAHRDAGLAPGADEEQAARNRDHAEAFFQRALELADGLEKEGVRLLPSERDAVQDELTKLGTSAPSREAAAPIESRAEIDSPR